MPRNERVLTVVGFAGVNLEGDPTSIEDNQFRRLQNYYPPRGARYVLAKRQGSVKYNATAIASVTRIDNAVRAWKMDGTKKLIVAGTKAGADVYYVGDDLAGTFAAITGGTALPTGAHHAFVNWPLIGKLYMLTGAAGVPIQVTSDFATKSDLVIGAGATDAKFAAHGAIFDTRLVVANTPTNHNFIYWFDVAAETIAGSQFWRINEPVTALSKNTFGTADQSLREVLVAFGAHSMWRVIPPANQNAIEQISRVVGCKSPKTLVNTPIGLMFLGSDRMVYLMQSEGDPSKVGLAIYPDTRAIPEAQLIDAAACYHDGYYKLTYPASGGTTNTIQWWADVLRVQLGEARLNWYGPMLNLALACFVVQDGPDDPLDLLAGDDTTGTVWKLDQPDLFVDGALGITGQIHTKEFNEGEVLREKIWNGYAFGYLKQDTGAVSVTAVVDAGRTSFSKAFQWTGAGSLWDVASWDVDEWAGDSYQEDVLNWELRIVGKTVQLQLEHATAADWRLRDFTRKAKTVQRMP